VNGTGFNSLWPTHRAPVGGAVNSLVQLAAGLVFLAAGAVAQDGEAGLAALDGRWVAEARLPGQAMTLMLDLAAVAGGLDARISVPAERVLGLGVEGFVFAEGEVSFRIPHPDHPMDFAGRVEGGSIDGALAMAGRELPLAFRRAGPIPLPPYTEIQVSFPGAERTVAGSLLVPPGEGPHPALVLFHATSMGRRDDLRFYADLAARADVAALIYDRRPVPTDLARLSRADFLTVVADAEAAVRFLRAHRGIDAERVGVGGLSQGAWISGIVASRTPEVGFVIALSPPGVALHEIDLYQSNQRLEQAGVRGAELAEANQLLVDLHAAAREQLQPPGTLAERLQRGRTQPWASVLDLPSEVPPRGPAGALLRWSADDLDPADSFGLLRMPVLMVFGGRDERLPAERCLERLRERLARSGHVDNSVLFYPQANHALLPAPDFESDLTAWIRARARPEKR
jgi:uncharacterized protein